MVNDGKTTTCLCCATNAKESKEKENRESKTASRKRDRRDDNFISQFAMYDGGSVGRLAF